MHTTIKTKVKPSDLEKLFERTDLVYIKFYKNASGNEILDSEKPSNFFINIRHNENEDAIKIFKNALEKLKNSSNVKKITLKPSKMKIFFFKKYRVKNTNQSTHVIFYSDTLVRTTLGEFTHSEFHEKHELNDYVPNFWYW